MPIKFWGLIFKASVHLINKFTSSFIEGKSLYEMLFCRVPSLTHVRVTGCKCYALVPLKADKFSKRDKPAVLMGYSFSKSLSTNRVSH